METLFLASEQLSYSAAGQLLCKVDIHVPVGPMLWPQSCCVRSIRCNTASQQENTRPSPRALMNPDSGYAICAGSHMLSMSDTSLRKLRLEFKDRTGRGCSPMRARAGKKSRV